MTVGTVILAIFVFGLLIFIHELGHFIAAKRANIKVNEFALGMGPRILQVQRGETVYALRLFPIGGMVAMEGEEGESTDGRSFQNASMPRRLIVTVAGAAMNLLLGLVILLVLSSQMNRFGSTQVTWFAEDAVSNQYLQEGDTILKVNGRKVRTDNDLIYEFMRDRDGFIELLVDRPGQGQVTLPVQFRMDELAEGIEAIYVDFKVEPVTPTFTNTISYAFNWTQSIVKQVWGSLIDLVTGRYGMSQLSGPVGVTNAISEASSMGWRSLLLLVSYITVNLGVFNLLPLPALDGGRLLFLLIELVRRKPVNPDKEALVHAVGLLLLFGLMIFVTFNDIVALITG